MCVHIFREHSFCLWRDQFGLSFGLAKKGMVRVSLPPCHPPRVGCVIVKTALQLWGQKTATAVKGLHSCASFPNDHSYLSIYLEQREVLPKSTCPHFSLKRWHCVERLPNMLNLLKRVLCWKREWVGHGDRPGAENIFRMCSYVCMFGSVLRGGCEGCCFFIFSKREVRDHGKRSAEVLVLPVTWHLEAVTPQAPRRSICPVRLVS